ncbi:Cytochrome p450 [Thalictrum thalictroides]|uniref:Cytochrome p450 n=1 Tax=Thalictrum thalictroides TaxID=46969 RepID=A0A7J6VTR7_THATH|nr:Cytochrome p450 [Thalictrum thalictroides]
MDVKGQHYQLIPFGAGRRACPAGTAFALQVMPLVMASLLHGFEVTTPMDMPVDMTETAGLTEKLNNSQFFVYRKGILHLCSLIL